MNQHVQVIEPNQNITSKSGLSFKRIFTKEGLSPFDMFEYETRSSVIRNPDGGVVFELNNVEVPKQWSQVATDILAQKYFRKAGVPQADGTTGSETSVKQVVHRLAHCWRVWGERYNYFENKESADIFYDECVYMLLAQIAAPNSPQWFNVGLFESYGIKGEGNGHWYVCPTTGVAKQASNAYERPQTSACFILSVKDDLVNEGGIMDLWQREARIFKYGSGVGTNYSNIRGEGETLSGGGNSSGLMSFLKIGDRAAGAIKSGGTTRRAAKMVILDADHPEIMPFIKWKQEEEKKVAALIAAGYSSDYEGEAYKTVSGQNANNSVRLTNYFFEALQKNADWHTTERTTGKVVKTYKAQEVWEAINQAAWACADPGLQFDTTINEWHTCPAGGRINASNPCSEYLFLDDTACNLASLNLRKFLNENNTFEVNNFVSACELWTVVLEISVLMAQFPSKEIAVNSYDYRTLGLGYANLGSMLMVMGIPYHSEKANAIAGAITAIMQGTAYSTSALLAKHLGTFAKYPENSSAMLNVVNNHLAAADASVSFSGLSIIPKRINSNICPAYLLEKAKEKLSEAVDLGKKFGYRNAQVTVLAPTGTIGLLMDCDTTGVEPDFALVKFKKLSGGGYFKIINQSIPLALKNLGYTEKQIGDIVHYIIGHGNLNYAPYINKQTLKDKGLSGDFIESINKKLENTFDINYIYLDNGKSLVNYLTELNFSEAEIESLNEYVCGTMTVEGAPHLKHEHYPIFDCANKCGKKGTRFIAPEGHIEMMASVQPFISGAISKTINLPNEATIADIKDCYLKSWQLGLKAVSLYRDGCKLSQPLASKSKDKKEDKEDTVANQVVERQTEEAFGQNKTGLTQKDLLQSVVEYLNEGGADEFRESLRRMVNRRQLPNKRRGFTQKAKVGGQTIFVRTGEYEDGTLGEIFIDMHKEGATLRSLMNCFAIAVSIGLQYGVPLEEFVDKFTFTRFEPAGMVEHPNIKQATSIVDYIFRLLALEYLEREDLVQMPRNSAEAPPATRADEIQIVLPNLKSVPTMVFANGNGIHKNGNGQATRSSIEASQKLMSNLMGDAPACNVCGHITVRNGSCYKCMNCGNSMGCS